jgi:hypothetical protein
MSKLKINLLALTWSVSRGRETYGWNIARLDSRDSGKRYRTCGGGYDMIGTVLGQYVENELQGKLRELVHSVSGLLVDAGYTVPGYRRINDLYGLTVAPNGHVQIDGGCGVDCVIRIIRGMNMEVQRTYNKKGHTTGFLVSEIIED